MKNDLLALWAEAVDRKYYGIRVLDATNIFNHSQSTIGLKSLEQSKRTSSIIRSLF